MANSTTHSQLPPVYGALWNLWIAYRKADGTSLAPTSIDTEVSLDAGTFADATNEVTLIKEVGGATDSALGYITLTAAEMTADSVMVQSKSANCVTEMVAITPARIVPVREATAQAGAAGTITLDASASAQDDAYNGMVVRTNAGTGPGQVRVITDYVGSTKVATIAPNWATNPSSDTTFTVGLLPYVQSGGLVTQVATGGIVAASFAAGAIDAAAIAADAIDADALKADAVTKIATGVTEKDAAGYEAGAYNGTKVGHLLVGARAGTFGKFVVDDVADTLTLYEVDGVTVIAEYPILPAGGPYLSRGVPELPA